jgi:hypothetical protein
VSTPAVATSSVKSAICDSVSGGKGCSRLVEAAITPHVRPPTTIGQPTDERMPSAWASCAIGPDAPVKVSTRAGRPVSYTWTAMLAPSRAKRVPTARWASPLRLQAAIAVTVRSGSKRSMRARSASHCSPTSRVTASKTSDVGTACATSVATRRSAACSWASRRSSFWASSASRARARASRARSFARRASSLTMYAATIEITNAAAVSPRAIAKLCRGWVRK